MSLEIAIQNLADAINNLAASAAGNPPLAKVLEAVPTADAPRPRGRPRKAEAEVEAPVAPAEAAAKVAERIAAVSAEAVAPTPVAVPTPPAAPSITKADVQKLLIAVVQKHGRDECGKLCQKHGGPNLSALDPSVYPALAADAQAVLATEADPVA